MARPMGSMGETSVAIGAIHGTSYEIYRPQIEPQNQYNSSHRNYHAIHIQIAVYTGGMIWYLESGFLGRQNDAKQFSLFRRIGRDLPGKIYPNRHAVFL